MYKLPRFFQEGIGLLLCLVILLIGLFYFDFSKDQKSEASEKSSNTNSSIYKSGTSNQMSYDNKEEPVNWLLPTGGPYPVIGPNDSIWIKVSKEQQRVFIMNGNKAIYTMICSTGLDTSPDTFTPEGTFYIQKERGISFYNPREKEGAKYWVSWKNQGEFLFHSVATDKNGNVIESEAMKLGHKASHGCVRLGVPDAKWIYDNIKYNTKVVIS